MFCQCVVPLLLDRAVWCMAQNRHTHAKFVACEILKCTWPFALATAANQVLLVQVGRGLHGQVHTVLDPTLLLPENSSTYPALVVKVPRGTTGDLHSMHEARVYCQTRSIAGPWGVVPRCAPEVYS